MLYSCGMLCSTSFWAINLFVTTVEKKYTYTIERAVAGVVVYVVECGVVGEELYSCYFIVLTRVCHPCCSWTQKETKYELEEEHCVPVGLEFSIRMKKKGFTNPEKADSKISCWLFLSVLCPSLSPGTIDRLFLLRKRRDEKGALSLNLTYLTLSTLNSANPSFFSCFWIFF